MGTDEIEQRRAEHRAAALHHVGPEAGAGATVWARAVQDLAALHESARQTWVSSPDLETWERLHVTALILAVAIDQVLAFERRVRHLTADPELAQARASFDGVCPDAEGLRDLVSHLDAYAVGEGWRQTGRRMPPIDDQYLATFIYWGDGGSTILDLGGEHLNLRATAEAATDLAKVIERVRARHLERVEEEANAALRRRFGLSSEPG
jgi:hypothetical protein